MSEKNRRGAFPRLIFVLILAAAVAGCSYGKKAKAPGPVEMEAGGALVTLEVSSYKFSPSGVRIAKPGLVAFEIRNVSGAAHNFTISDPQGRTLKSIDINPRQTVITNIELTGPGVYKFYCNKTLHSTLGEKGLINVGGR